MNEAIKAAAEAVRAILSGDGFSFQTYRIENNSGDEHVVCSLDIAQAAIDAYFEALGVDREIFETNARHELTNKGDK